MNHYVALRNPEQSQAIALAGLLAPLVSYHDCGILWLQNASPQDAKGLGTEP